jgi:uncharacterized protein (DUF4415 family)
MSNSSHSNLDALRQMPDGEIDYSDIPPLDSTFFERAELRVPADQAPFFVRLDSDIVAWFKAQGKEYQDLINAALRAHITTHQ